jgi:hypothetical protein
MKRIALTGLVVMIGYQLGFAQSFDSTGGWECEHYTTGNQTYIVGGNGTQTQVTVPSKVYDPNNLATYTVTQLGDGTYPVWDDNMSALTIPSSVGSINSYSCAYLPYLAIVNIGGNPSIASYAFYQDPSLQSVSSISNDIGDSAFEGCTKLRNVGLKDGVTKIGKRAFANCKNLKSLTIPRTVISIAPDAFDGSGLKQVIVHRGQLVQYPKLPKGAFVRVRETAP